MALSASFPRREGFARSRQKRIARIRALASHRSSADPTTAAGMHARMRAPVYRVSYASLPEGAPTHESRMMEATRRAGATAGTAGEVFRPAAQAQAATAGSAPPPAPAAKLALRMAEVRAR